MLNLDGPFPDLDDALPHQSVDLFVRISLLWRLTCFGATPFFGHSYTLVFDISEWQMALEDPSITWRSSSVVSLTVVLLDPQIQGEGRGRYLSRQSFDANPSTSVSSNRWHYRIRVPHDTVIHTAPGAMFEVRTLLPSRGNAIGYQGVRLWEDGELECNLMMGNLDNAEEPWVVITDEPASLQTLWDYGKRFCCEELYLDSKSGVFDLEGNKIEEPEAIDRLYGVVAVALLYSTLQGMAVQLAGLRSEVDPHWKRGLSYLKIGIRWLKGVVSKGRKLFDMGRLLRHDPEPCFASKRAQQEYFEQRRFNRVRLIEGLR